nr:hypothetical protein GCM10020185_69890 [Pseudomonas brassicacearum subsp. brassicacearum]
MLEQVLALLVGAQPQVLEFEGVAGLRQHEQQRQAEQPASPPGTGGQQQQGQEQPITLVGPGVQAQGLSIAAQMARTVQQAQAAQVAVIQARRPVAAVQLIGERLEARVVEARQ